MSIAELVRTPKSVVDTASGSEANFRKAKQALRDHVLNSDACKVIFERYRSAGGLWELPVVAREPQGAAGARSAWADTRMMDLGESFVEVINDGDDQFVKPGSVHVFYLKNSPIIPRIRAQRAAAKKYLMMHDGSYGSRAKRKEESERLTRGIVVRYDATELDKKVIKKAEKKGLNVHDMADALLLALQVAIDLYGLLAKKVLPRRKRGEKRSDTPPLTPEQMGQGGTIRVVALDPGFNNIGLCVVELLAMQLPPEDSPHPDEPEPIFRVLLWDLIDGRQDFSKKNGHAKLHYVPSDPEAILQPNYDQEDIRSYFFDLKAKAAEKKKAAALERKKAKALEEAATAAAAAGEKLKHYVPADAPLDEEDTPRSKVKPVKNARGKKRSRKEEEDDGGEEAPKKKKKARVIKKRGREDFDDPIEDSEVEVKAPPKKRAKITVIDLASNDA